MFHRASSLRKKYDKKTTFCNMTKTED